MNNLHRELAPISDAAWSDIEEETTRTIKRYLAGRRVVDVQGPSGVATPAIGGIREGTSNPVKPLPADIRAYPDAIAQALSQLRLVGVNGPYSVLLSADAYTGLSETSDNGY